MITRAALLTLLLIATWAGAAEMERVGAATGDAAALDARLKRLESELRCLVCQNQTLADSNASLADDLRHEVRELAQAGKSDDEIRAFLVARYGDFVLYDPPLKATTLILWIGPFALLGGGAVLWWVVLRRREKAASTAPAIQTSDAEARARTLLDERTR